MASGDTQPTQPIPGEWAYAEAPSRRRGRIWPWLVAFAIVGALAIVAWFVGEAIARDAVTTTIRQQVVSRLALPADHEVAVDVAGPVIPQLIAGTLGEVTVSSDDVPIGEVVGDVTVIAHGVPLRGGDLAGATATVVLDEEQLRALMATVDGFPADSLALDDPDVTMSTELSFFGIGIPVGVALTPTAVDGDIVLSPAALQVAGADISVEGLRDQFGVVAELVLRDWTVCLAQYIPAGLELTAVAVAGDEIVAEFDVDGAIVSDPALLQNGTCE